MSPADKDTILARISELEAANYEQVILDSKQSYESDGSLVSEFSHDHFLKLTIRAIDQQKAELSNSERLGTLLPLHFWNDSGFRVSIVDCFINLCSYLLTIDLNHTIIELKNIIQYQIYFGFWDRGSINLYSVAEINLKETKESIDNLSNSIQNLLTQYNDINNLHNSALLETSEISNKLAEIIELKNLAENSVSDIKHFKDNSEETNSQTKEILTETKTFKEESGTLLSSLKLEYSDYNKKLELRLADLETALADAHKLIDDQKIALDKIKAEEKYIIELTGKAADGALGNRFSDRAERLQRSVNIWIALIFLGAIISGRYIYFMFTELDIHYSNEWLTILSYSLRLSPVGLFMIFIINQYRKERNLQEEYTFKAAVAMTLTAYADMLKNANSDELKVRAIMIQSTIDKIYTNPKIHHEPSLSLLPNRSKLISDIIKQVLEIQKISGK